MKHGPVRKLYDGGRRPVIATRLTRRHGLMRQIAENTERSARFFKAMQDIDFSVPFIDPPGPVIH